MQHGQSCHAALAVPTDSHTVMQRRLPTAHVTLADGWLALLVVECRCGVGMKRNSCSQGDDIPTTVRTWFIARTSVLFRSGFPSVQPPFSTSPLRLSRRLAHLASQRCSVSKAGTRPPAPPNTLEAPSILPTPTHRAALPGRVHCSTRTRQTLLLCTATVCSVLHRPQVARAFYRQHTTNDDGEATTALAATLSGHSPPSHRMSA
jgi:hypothetical protein